MERIHIDELNQMIRRHKRRDLAFAILGMLCLFCTILVLCSLLVDLAMDGVPRITKDFFFAFPSRFADQAGILSAWVGSTLVMLVTACVAIPIGIAAAVYLEEYAKKNFFTAMIEVNISNLAGVPSIVFGLMALGIFIYKFHLGSSVITAGFTLSLLILPIVITATREAIRAIPVHIREAAMAVGASKWQTIQHHVLPYSTGGILTGIVIALSRAIGETAPLITIGALTFIAFLPPAPLSWSAPYVNADWLSSPFTVMPIQMFNWISRPQPEFHVNAAATGVILLGMTLSMNAIAIYLRYRFRKRIKW
jgi:phosphate transport system permease protein